MTMKRIGLVLLLLTLCPLAFGKHKEPSTYTIPLPPRPDFSPVDWLVGDWTGQTTGSSPRADLRLSVRYALERRVMVFREELSFQATKSVPAAKESWMGILSAPRSRPPYILHAYSSTGFLTRYEVTADGSDIRFNFSGGLHPPSGWLFRRLIERAGNSEFVETVQVAPPGRPFFNYYKAKFTRTLPSQPPAGAPSP
jgi:hypothetical protein